MSVAGDGLMARMRTAWFGALGMSTAVGLALIAFAVNQGLPNIRELPFPNAPIEFGDAQGGSVSPTVTFPAGQFARDRDSSPAGAKLTQRSRRTPADARFVEAQKIAAEPGPEPTPVEQPPPPSPSVPNAPGPAAQPQAPSSPPASLAAPPPPSSPPAASTSAPKGKGVGLGRARGQEKVKSDPGAKDESDPGAKDESDPGAKGESDPSATIPPTAQAPGPAGTDHAEKHPGKSDKGH